MKIYVVLTLVLAMLIFLTPSVYAEQPLPVPVVLHESEVFTLLPPDNGSGPLWSYGCTQIGRLGDTVYVSAMETGEGVPRLCNTRWRLMRFDGISWSLVAEDEKYRQREPCPIAVMPPSKVVLNVNDSTEPPGTEYGPCIPRLTLFETADVPITLKTIEPQWDQPHHFTDHSYRGFAVDPKLKQLLMLNIDATTSIQNVCLVNVDGETLATADIEFPIRSCYPQAALNEYAAYVLAVGDIVEPVEEWRTYKYEQTHQKWDYVFRRLFFTWTPDIRNTGFASPVEIENLDATCGHITNQDLWISPDGEAWILYTQQDVQNVLVRDRFFPDKSISNSLWLVRVKEGLIVEKRVLLAERPDRNVSQAKFHAAEGGAIYIVLHLTGADAGNKLMRLIPGGEENTLLSLPLETPLYWYCLATVRAGNAPSKIIDVFGNDGRTNIYRYACINITLPAN